MMTTRIVKVTREMRMRPLEQANQALLVLDDLREGVPVRRPRSSSASLEVMLAIYTGIQGVGRRENMLEQ